MEQGTSVMTPRASRVEEGRKAFTRRHLSRDLGVEGGRDLGGASRVGGMAAAKALK